MAALPLENPIFRLEDGTKTIVRTGMLVKTFVAVAASAFLIAVAASPAAAQNVRWHHIIGIKQAGNMVGNITGGGQPWSASGGHARVDLATGNMEFEVHGLVLAGGNSIGTPGLLRSWEPSCARPAARPPSSSVLPGCRSVCKAKPSFLVTLAPSLTPVIHRM
jgi:hypothetical protein